LTAAALALLIAACATEKRSDTAADTAAGTMRTDADQPQADPDQPQAGTGVPAGYTAITDKPDAKITDAKYSVTGSRWEVRTGPAHIIYAAKDTASGVYAVTTTIEQLEKPRHPEAFGLIVGGQNLDDRARQKYGYFLVRGGGEYLVKVRDGTATTTVTDWKTSPDIPKEDASGKATYKLTVHVAPDTVHFMVNGKLVGAAPKSALPTGGIAGLRINHNLHVAVSPVAVSKG
jgi:hypothetical protein